VGLGTTAIDGVYAFTAFLQSKFSLPSDIDGIVLDVGSGHSPHYRANVLVERYAASTGHRAGPAARRDANQFLLWADAARLPFRDDVVSYSIVSHVLEHVEDPATVCGELTRVGRRGYIECPNAWIEAVLPYPSHAWYVRLDDGVLRFVAKDDRRFARLPDDKWSNRRIRSLFRQRSLWTVQLEWRDGIRCEVTGAPMQSALSGDDGRARSEFAERAIGTIGRVLGTFASSIPLTERELAAALCCPRCRGDVNWAATYVECGTCRVRFLREGRTIDFLTPSPGVEPAPDR
jgi:hypothetical protein